MASLHQELSSLRHRLARDRGMPVNASASRLAMSLENIFSDTVLSALVEACPQDQEALTKIPRLSSFSREHFGLQILRVCTRPDFSKKRSIDATDADIEAASKRQATGSTGDVRLPDSIEPSELTSEQRQWAAAALAGDSLFITGEAGTGKSFLLAYIVQELKRTKAVATTATTGIVAASHGGVTLHAFAGIGLGKGSSHQEIIAKVMMSGGTVARWQETEVLVVDEISMLDGDTFQLLDQLARRARGVDKPFGGLQLLICGDFLQLPPVSASSFAFQTAAWHSLAPKTAELTRVVRQHGDDAFLSILREVRVGICSASSSQALAKCCIDKKPLPLDGILPTRLYCTNKDVDAENDVRLNQLDGAIVEVHAQDEWKENTSQNNKEKLLDMVEKKAPSLLKLKVRAQVVITKNLPTLNIMNGTRGVIESWAPKKDGLPCPVVRCDNGELVQIDPAPFTQSGVSGTGQLTRTQLPLKLGWALTVHRAQGCTLTRAELQLENAFDFGQVYVALSRVKSLNGLWIRGRPVTQKEVKANATVLHFYYAQAGA